MNGDTNDAAKDEFDITWILIAVIALATVGALAWLTMRDDSNDATAGADDTSGSSVDIACLALIRQAESMAALPDPPAASAGFDAGRSFTAIADLFDDADRALAAKDLRRFGSQLMNGLAHLDPANIGIVPRIIESECS